LRAAVFLRAVVFLAAAMLALPSRFPWI